MKDRRKQLLHLVIETKKAQLNKIAQKNQNLRVWAIVTLGEWAIVTIGVWSVVSLEVWTDVTLGVWAIVTLVIGIL